MESENHAKVVELSFNKEEWNLLMDNRDFSEQLKNCCKSLDDVERLCAMGELLVLDWKQSKSPFGYL